jgi:hypothetical protein
LYEILYNAVIGTKTMSTPTPLAVDPAVLWPTPWTFTWADEESPYILAANRRQVALLPTGSLSEGAYAPEAVQALGNFLVGGRNFAVSQAEVADAVEVIASGNFRLGEAVGWEEAAKHILNLAGEAFKRGDAQAEKLRDLAAEIKNLGKVRRADYESNGRPAAAAAIKAIVPVED